MSKTDIKRSRFTFLEIMVAVAILSASLAVVLTILGSSRSRLMRAERRWAGQHVLSNAVEFYLLAGTDAAIPGGVLPDGFSASCDLEAAEDLPEHAAEAVGGWMLGRYRIEVFNAGRQNVGEQIIEKVVLEEDLR